MKSASYVRLLLACCVALAQDSAGVPSPVLFRDDFNGAQLDTSHWGVANWALGRSQLGNVPEVSGGMLHLRFDTYGFAGTEIYTLSNFARGNGIEFSARMRMNNLPGGLVTALFTYNTQNALVDEIDIECLSKQVNATIGGAPLQLTTWNNWDEAHPTYNDGVHQSTRSAFVPHLDVNEFHNYAIRWLPGHTQWLVDGVLVADSSLAQPDLATPLHINLWAPASTWTDAYDASLQPVGSIQQDVAYSVDVDWVQVRTISPFSLPIPVQPTR
jgi:beta-glucanase (GH16 family)